MLITNLITDHVCKVTESTIFSDDIQHLKQAKWRLISNTLNSTFVQGVKGEERRRKNCVEIGKIREEFERRGQNRAE